MKRIVVLSVIALALAAPAADAQRARGSSDPVELGIDGGVTFGLDDPNVTVVALPAQDFRLGYFVSDKLELEPRFNVNSVHGGGISVTTYGFEFGLLLMPSGDRVGDGIYLRPFLGVVGISVSGGGGNQHHGEGGGGGRGEETPPAGRPRWAQTRQVHTPRLQRR